MQPLQKLLLLESSDLNRLMIWRLMEAFEKAGIEYRMLSFPVIDLEIYKFVAPDKLKEFAADWNLADFASRSINFDIFVPALKWVFNLHQVNASNNFLAETVKASIKNCRTSTGLKNPESAINIGLIPDEGHLDEALFNCIMCYFKQHEIVNPLDKHPEFRLPKLSESVLTFDSQNLEKLEYYLKKNYR